MNGKGDNYAYEDIDNNELSKKFGKDLKGRVRAIGSNVSKKQLIHLGIATEKFEQLKKANEEEDAMKNELFSRFDSRLNNFEDILKIGAQVVCSKYVTINMEFNGTKLIMLKEGQHCWHSRDKGSPTPRSVSTPRNSTITDLLPGEDQTSTSIQEHILINLSSFELYILINLDNSSMSIEGANQELKVHEAAANKDKLCS
ncbi:hypothetical protein LguiA_033942 [Lonicera macranthoides]